MPNTEDEIVDSFFHVTKKGPLHISEGESVPDNYGVEPEEYI